jgi:hypothetical protein
LDEYFKIGITNLSYVRIEWGERGRRRVTPIMTVLPALGGAESEAARWKSTKTNLRHAPRLFSSDHQPARHPAMPARLPATHLKPSSGSMEKRA